jgi:acyl-CoA thioester hydrolase
MGIMHNSNYYRWFEEARIDYMDQTKYPLKVIEGMGIFLPVAASSAEFFISGRICRGFLCSQRNGSFTGYR